MKPVSVWLVLLLVGLILPARPDEAALPLTMDEAVRLALANNPGIRAAAARLEQARQNEQIVASPGRTQATLSAYRDRQRTAFGPPFETGLGALQIPIQAEPLEYSTSSIRILFRQLLFDGGRIAARIEEARANARGVEQSLVASYNDLVLEVRLKYLDLLQARRQESETRERLELARRQLEETEARYDAGSAARADVVYARLPVSQAELASTRLGAQIESSQTRLNKLLGLPQDTELDAAEPDPPGPLPGDLEVCLGIAREKRPELARFHHEIAAARSAVQAAARENGPEVHAVGELSGVAYNEDWLPKSEAWRVALELSWPLLDGHRSFYLERQAQARVDELEALLAEHEHQVEQEVREAFVELQTAIKAYEVAQVGVARAREALEMAQGQYGVGVAPFLQVSQAQLDFSQARTDLLEALYDYHRSRTQLEWALGQVRDS
ncbi:MAG: TolC family protein [Armatimonadetes bacterium]|nr:TolC family protein [Armatimonadota bacterium]